MIGIWCGGMKCLLVCVLLGGPEPCAGAKGRAAGEQQAGERARSPEDERIQAVIDAVDKACRERTVFMIGPNKAERLAELVRQTKPNYVVECGTALGYSGLWIARELEALGGGKLVTIEIDARRAREAGENFRKAGLEKFVTVKVGDARQIVRGLEPGVDFLFIDCNFQNYYPCFTGIEDKLEDGAIVVADNAGVGADAMADYLKLVRSRYDSCIEWFDLDLPWGKRDAMEITRFRRPKKRAPTN